MLTLLFLILGSIAADCAWFAALSYRHVGRFKVLTKGESVFRFQTQLGQYTVLPKERSLTADVNGKKLTARADEIKGIEYHVNEDYAFVEEWLMGYDLTDRLAKYHDAVLWFAITLVKTDGTRIPIFLSGQYERREFLMSWYTELQEELLTRLGLRTDVQLQSQAVLEALQKSLPGVPLR